ncbi:alpha/beta hydrolase [Amycolatopsis sp. FDAARGOS 1241]|uniref:alpha/beta hydrolase n=1 Tax=Amycolatopsis sp. FDAARGOS 1241 TaxID=2778070 RepID=UPI001EF2DC27|nr:alpha/beta hydrolase [Amycolatopsis sp. FDAARGOS 1241]
MRRAVFAAVAAATLASLVAAPAAGAAPAAPAPAAYTPPPVAWGPCDNAGLQAAGAQCGFVTVPLDYQNPGGAKAQLAVSRIKHKTPDSQYQGVMLTNPGGPGGSGLTLARVGGNVPNHAGDAYDWIGFDPRGVGSSKPALSCDNGYTSFDRPSYVPLTPQLEKTWLDRAKNYAADCAKKNPKALLDNLKTTDTVRDMDSIRAALGAEQINFYGYSYGTYLGQVYGTMFPQRVRRMVLDSTVDPRNVWYQANLNQDVAFDRNINIWFGWLAKYDSTYHLGKTQAAVKATVDRELVKLSLKPAGGQIGPDELTDVIQQASYYQLTWLGVADALSALVTKGDPSQVKALFESDSDNGYAVYLGVQCTDVQWPTNWNQWRVDNWKTFLKAPYFTWQNAWFNAPCVFWPAKAGKPVQVDGKGVKSVLMIDETLDAATPYEGSLEVRSRFPGASLIAEPGGTSHAITPRGNACVDTKIADYLATGALPARKPGRTADVECAPLPQPQPAPSAPAAQEQAKARSLPLVGHL